MTHGAAACSRERMMKCPKCEHENRKTRRFCAECGEKLVMLCPQCACENLPDEKFCGDCGHDLRTPSSETFPKELSYDEKLAKIQKYLPSGLTQKVLSQRDRIEGERRQVTIMFVDMKGFTPLTEKLGPEETFSLMDRVFEILIHKVHQYEGTVNELRGDGILAFFGAPIALEDAPQRAIRSALSIHRAVTRFNDKIKQDKKIPPVLLRIGINTGPVVIGTVGNDLRVQFTAVGDTINMAARMEQMAEPGTTYVTEDTFKLAKGFFRFEALGEKEVKGKEKPMRVFRVIAPSSRRTRFEVSAEHGLTPLVARERELDLMLDGFDRVKRGSGKVFSIVGEAGVGKSRLLYEFRKAVSNEYVTFLEGKCLSYGRGAAYHPIIDILKSNFDLGEEDGDQEVRQKVTNGLKVLDGSQTSALPYILELLSVKKSGIEKIPASPEAKRDRTIEALKAIVLKGSEIRPLVLAIEDLHWIDKNSEEVLKNLFRSIPGARVLLIFTYRPEYAYTWPSKSFHTHLTLNRLSVRDSRMMAAHLLGMEEYEKDLDRLILEQTEGIPFFIEEFVKSLKELKIIEKKDDRYRMAKDVQEATIPSTIQDVIMARVDSLPQGSKEVLQTGAVIEREFSYELMKRVTGLPESELLSYLSALKDSELLFERGIFPRSNYIFKHALTRDVIYDSILTGTKKKLHQEIGTAIEDLYQVNLEQHFGVLAEHFIAGQDFQKGADYSKLAGRKAARSGALGDATKFAGKRIVCIEKLPGTVDVLEQLVDARTLLGLYYAQRQCNREAKEAVDPVLDLATEQNDKRRLSQIYSIQGTYYCWAEENFSMAVEYLERALRLSHETDDIVSLVQANWWLGVALAFSCKFQRALQHMQKALEINVAAKNLWAMSVTKGNMVYHVYFVQGRFDLACQNSSEAMVLAEESGDIWSKFFAHFNQGLCYLGKGMMRETIAEIMKSLDLAKRIDYLTGIGIAESFLGDTYFELGEYEKAKDNYERSFHDLGMTQVLPSLSNLSRIGSAMTSLLAGERNVDMESLFSYVSENRMGWNDGQMRRYIAAILLNIDDQHISEAQHWIEEAIEADKRNGMRFHLARDYALYAELFKRKEDRVKAKEQLGKAIEIYRECGADGWVTKAEEELARLS